MFRLHRAQRMGRVVNGYVRISLSVSDDRLHEALTRMKNWYKQQ